MLTDFKVLCNLLTQPVAITELRTDGYAVVYANEAFLSYTGFSAEEVIGKEPRALQRQDLTSDQKDQFQKAIEQRCKTTVEVTGRKKDGTLCWSRISVAPFVAIDNENGKSTLLIEEHSDITDLLEKQTHFSETLQKFDLAIAGSADGLWCLEVGTDKCWYSPRFRELLGYSEEDFPPLLSSWTEALHPEDRETTLEAVRNHLVRRQPYIIEYRLRAQSGEYRWFEARGQCTLDEKEQPVHLAGSIRDITARRLAEQELKSARDEALQASRLKTEFLANISHEIRTPLNGVIGMTNMLLRTTLNDDQTHYATTIREAGQSLLSLISDILDLSAIEAGQMRLATTEFDLSNTVESVAQLLAPHAHTKGLTLATVISPEVPPLILGDEERLRQILFNLTSNAVKFTDHGTIGIIADVIPCKDPSKLSIQISVTDSGIGIEAEDIEKLFQNFVQLDGSSRRKHGGTGLGLAISQRMAGLMGGQIVASSAAGAGSTFTLTLPVSAVKTSARATPMKDQQIHLVHHCELIRKSLGSIFESQGAAVTYSDSIDHSLTKIKSCNALVLPRSIVEKNAHWSQCVREANDCGTKLLLISEADSTDRDCDVLRPAAAVITLPVRRSQLVEALNRSEGPSTKPAVSSRDDATALGTVLIAEDHPVNQEVAKLYLTEMGFQADVVPDGRSAVEALTSGNRSYALVLMDCQMPDVDGYQATRIIREWENGRGTRIPIIAMTAHTMKGDRDKCLDAGMDDYVSKPIYPESLQEIMNKWNKQPIPQPLDVEAARKRFGEKGLTTLLRLFLEDVPSRFDSFEQAIKAGNLVELANLSHGLMGASATIQARQLKTLSGELEIAARNGQIEEAQTLFKALKEEHELLKQLATDLLKS
ncbi:MAG: PAS domain-containing protein [Candidatus Obscuribacterales bacterium]|nr:PAS domain-containing protein [Candidatus Obscuribacterales bacterium]